MCGGGSELRSETCLASSSGDFSGGKGSFARSSTEGTVRYSTVLFTTHTTRDMTVDGADLTPALCCNIYRTKLESANDVWNRKITKRIRQDIGFEVLTNANILGINGGIQNLGTFFLGHN
jgi:hypothetical protein